MCGPGSGKKKSCEKPCEVNIILSFLQNGKQSHIASTQ